MMGNFVTKIMKLYDTILNIAFVLLVLFTAFVICYYALPNQTSIVIAKALSYSKDPTIAKTFMDYLSGFTIGAGFPLFFSQKAMVSRYINNATNKFATMSVKSLLVENMELGEIQIEFQKAEALRFSNSPTMPAKARLHYKSFLDKLEEREQHVTALKQQYGLVEKEKKKKPKKTKRVVNKTIDRTDALI